MRESTLAAAFKDLMADVGFDLGFGRGEEFGEKAWTLKQTSTLERCVKGGIRSFYHCGYDWSFLKPIASLTLPEGERVVAMPFDYGGLEGDVSVANSDSWGVPVRVVGDVNPYYAQNPNMTGSPQCVTIEPLRGAAGHTQRSQLHVYPEADQDYTLSFAYYLVPDMISGSMPFAYGGPQHAQTLLAACQAEGERVIDNILDGPHQVNFQRLLDASKSMDRRNKPQHLGYNADRSDSMGYVRPRRWNTITLGGVDPS